MEGTMGRYQVVDECCGCVCHCETKDGALVAAQLHFDLHVGQDGNGRIAQTVEIYDRMAHRGAAQLWGYRDGAWTVIERKGQTMTHRNNFCEVCSAPLKQDEEIVCDDCQVDRLEGLLESPEWMEIRGPHMADDLRAELGLLRSGR